MIRLPFTKRARRPEARSEGKGRLHAMLGAALAATFLTFGPLATPGHGAPEEEAPDEFTTVDTQDPATAPEGFTESEVHRPGAELVEGDEEASEVQEDLEESLESFETQELVPKSAQTGPSPREIPTHNNYLQWEVKADDANVGPSTFEVQTRPSASGSWSVAYPVTDCVAAPCGNAGFGDQDPRPGHFAVEKIRTLNPTGAGSWHTWTVTGSDTSSRQYRVRPMGSMPDYEWTLASSGWQTESADPRPVDFGTFQPTLTGPSEFTELSVENSEYFSLVRGSTETTSQSARNNHIQRLTYSENTDQTVTKSETVANSSVTLPGEAGGYNKEISNGLGLTHTGVFYFVGQYVVPYRPNQGPSVLGTVYRFDPEKDGAPYPVHTLDLLEQGGHEPGYVVAGDAVVTEAGDEELYYGSYSTEAGLGNGGGTDFIHLHLYRYSYGKPERTGEVAHVKVARPQGFTTNSNQMNGDFAFDADNNLHFVVADNNGMSISGVVERAKFEHLNGLSDPGDVPTIQGKGNVGQLQEGRRQSINGLTFTPSGRLIIEQGQTTAFADPTSLYVLSPSQVAVTAGAAVDLTSGAMPPTITVQKVVDGQRFDDADQFELNAVRSPSIQGAPVVTFQSALTEGTLPGLQAQQVGPYVIMLDGKVDIGERLTNAETADGYRTTWECHVEGEEEPFLQNDPNATAEERRQLSFDLAGTGKPPEVTNSSNIVCVFTNRPVGPAEIVVHKDVIAEEGGGAPIPKEGWEVSVDIEANGVVFPYIPNKPTEGQKAEYVKTQETSSSGDAYWAIDFEANGNGVLPTTTINVSEQVEGMSFVQGSCIHDYVHDGVPDTKTYKFDQHTAADGMEIPDVGPGDRVSCSFINGGVPTLQLCKEIEDVEGGIEGLKEATPRDWGMSATELDDADQPLEGGDDHGFPEAPCSEPHPITPGRFMLSEKVKPFDTEGKPLPPASEDYEERVTRANTYDQLGTWTCERWEIVEGEAGEPEIADEPRLEELDEDDILTVYGADDEFEPQDGRIRCVVTNQSAQLTVLKNIEDQPSGIYPSDFTVTAKTYALDGITVPELDASGSANQSAANTIFVKPDTDYVVEETGDVPFLTKRVERYRVGEDGCPTDVDFEKASCWETVVQQPGDETTERTVSVEQGERAIYRFVNIAPEGPDLPLTGGASAFTYFVTGAGLIALATAAGIASQKRWKRMASDQ